MRLCLFNLVLRCHLGLVALARTANESSLPSGCGILGRFPNEPLRSGTPTSTNIFAPRPSHCNGETGEIFDGFPPILAPRVRPPPSQRARLGVPGRSENFCRRPRV